jgi:hypothetical protein
MGYYLPETVSGQPNLTAKNRVWGFFGESVSVCLETCSPALEPHQENYDVSRKAASGIPLWPSRDPIGERGGVNLYGFLGNDGVNRWDYIGLSDLKAMNEAVHTGASDALRRAETEYLNLLKSDNPLVITENVENNKPYKPKKPREYGGRVCEKCTITNGVQTYSYKLTETKGSWPWQADGGAHVVFGAAPQCEKEKGYEYVANWHTHPSNLIEDPIKVKLREKPKSKYHWGAADSFSGQGMDRGQKMKLFVTRRGDPSSGNWQILTEVLSIGAANGVRVDQSDVFEAEWIDLGDAKP